MRSGIAGKLRPSPRFRGSGTHARMRARTAPHNTACDAATETLDRHSGARVLDTRGRLTANGFRFILRGNWPPDYFAEKFGLHDAHFEVVDGAGGPTLFLRVQNAWASKRLWRVTGSWLQVFLLDRWVHELVDEIRAQA